MTNRMKEQNWQEAWEEKRQVRDLEKAFEKEIIEQYVLREGLHKEKRPAVVMWWEIRKR